MMTCEWTKLVSLADMDRPDRCKGASLLRGLRDAKRVDASRVGEGVVWVVEDVVCVVCW